MKNDRMRSGFVLGALLVALCVVVSAQIRQGSAFQFNNGTLLLSDSVDPEGAKVAPVGSVYLRTSNGKWYRKETGSSNTGWKQTAPVFFSATDRVLCRDTSGSGDAEECSASQILDMVGSTRGSIVYRGASGWSILIPGSSGECLKSGGAGADPAYGNCLTGDGGGDVTAASGFGTDGLLIRADGTGKGVQASGIGIDDSDNVTGMKLDCEDTGNDCVFTSIEKYVTAGCQAGVPTLGMNTMTGLAPTAVCITGTNTVRAAAQFPDADGEYHLQIDVPLLPGFTGTVDFFGKWRTAATSGDLVLQVQWACTADGAVANDSWSTASTVTDTAKGTTLQLNTWSMTGVTLTGCDPDEDIVLRIMRQRTHASDSLSGTFDLLPFYAVFRGTK